MNEKIFVAPSLKTEQYSDTDLSIQIAPDGLVFFAGISSTGECKAFAMYPVHPDLNEESWMDELEKILAGNIWLKGNWKTVRVLWITNKWLAVPSAYFRPEEARNFLIYHELFREYDEVHYYSIREPETTFVFPVPGSVSQLLRNVFPSFRYFPSWAPVSLYFDAAKPQGLCVLLHYGFADYYVHSGKGISNFSRFNWQEPSDILFFLAKISRDFSLDLVSGNLIMCGYPGLAKAAATEALVREYFPSLNAGMPALQMNPAIKTQFHSLEIPVQLMNLQLCE